MFRNRETWTHAHNQTRTSVRSERRAFGHRWPKTHGLWDEIEKSSKMQHAQSMHRELIEGNNDFLSHSKIFGLLQTLSAIFKTSYKSTITATKTWVLSIFYVPLFILISFLSQSLLLATRISCLFYLKVKCLIKQLAKRSLHELSPLTSVAHVPLYKDRIPFSMYSCFAQFRGPLYFLSPPELCWTCTAESQSMLSTNLTSKPSSVQRLRRDLWFVIGPQAWRLNIGYSPVPDPPFPPQYIRWLTHILGEKRESWETGLCRLRRGLPRSRYKETLDQKSSS